MTVKLFNRQVQKTVFPSEARQAEPHASVLARGTKLLDGETPTCIHVVEGGYVVEGENHAALILSAGGVTVARLSEAKGDDSDDDEEEDEPDDEEGDDEDEPEDDDDEEPDDDSAEPDDDPECEDVNESSRYDSIASAIAGTSLPRKLKTAAAEALASKFEELPGAFNRATFVRASIGNSTEDEETDSEEESIDEKAKLGSGARFKALSNKIAKSGKVHDPDAVAASIGRKKYGKKKFQSLAAHGESIDEATMTRKHYAMIADALAGIEMSTKFKRELVGAVASALAGTNEQFNRARFVKASGLNPSQVADEAEGKPTRRQREIRAGQTTLIQGYKKHLDQQIAQKRQAGQTKKNESLFIRYYDKGVQLVDEEMNQLARVQCDTTNHVESVRAINAIEEYARTIGFEPADEGIEIDEDTADESEILALEWDAVDDIRAMLQVALESCSVEEMERFRTTVAEIDSAINEGDFELAEQLAEPLFEYKRMGQSARRSRIRSLRMGIPKSVKAGKQTRSEHRRQLIKRRRMYRTSAGMRSKQKRYAKRTARYRARLRPMTGAKSESIPEANFDEAGDKLGVLAGEVMTYLINRPRSTAQDLERHFRMSNSAANAVMSVAVEALAQGKPGAAGYDGYVKRIGDALANDNAFETEGEQRRPFGLASEDAIARINARWGVVVEVDESLTKDQEARLDELERQLARREGLTSDERAEYKKLKARASRNRYVESTDEADKPEYGSAGYKDHDYTCGEVHGSTKCKLPAGHHGPHKKRKDDTDESAADAHQKRIAMDTLRLSKMGAGVMGGMDHKAAINYLLTKGGWTIGKVHQALKKAGWPDDEAVVLIRKAGGEAEAERRRIKGLPADESETELFAVFEPAPEQNIKRDPEYVLVGLYRDRAKAHSYAKSLDRHSRAFPLMPIKVLKSTTPAKAAAWRRLLSMSRGAVQTDLRESIDEAEKKINVRGFFGDDAGDDRRAKIGAGQVERGLAQFGKVKRQDRAGYPSGNAKYDAANRGSKIQIQQWTMHVPAEQEGELRAYLDANNLYVIRESLDEMKAADSAFGAQLLDVFKAGEALTSSEVHKQVGGDDSKATFRVLHLLAQQGELDVTDKGGRPAFQLPESEDDFDTPEFEAGVWGRELYGKKAATFSALKVGAKFKFPGSEGVLTKKDDRGWYVTEDGKRFKTGRHTAVLPESLDEGVDLPVNGKHTIRDPASYGGQDAPMIEVPAYKLAKATVFMPGGYGWVKHEVNDLVMWKAKYAQYPDALHVQFRQKGKRKAVAAAYGYKPRVIVYDGWGVDVDVEDPFNAPEQSSVAGVSTQRGKRLSQDPGWDTEMASRVSSGSRKPALAIMEGEARWVEIDEAGHTVYEAKEIPDINSATYRERVKHRGWNVKIDPLFSGGSTGAKLLVKRLPGWTKADHIAAAEEHERLAKKYADEWSATVEKASQETFGRPYQFTDYKISGIARDEFSDTHKDILRNAAHTKSSHLDAAAVHRAAAKLRRVPKAEEAESTPKIGDRVKVKGDKTGVVVSQHTLPDRKGYVERQQVLRVKLDGADSATSFRVEDVELDEAGGYGWDDARVAYALGRQFGDAWSKLSDDHMHLVIKDTASIMTYEDTDAAGAASLLRQRIGGPKNLQSYADTLAAGERRKKKHESLDEKKVECYLCGRTKEKHSGSDEEPYCRECDAKMEKLRDAQHARYEKMRKQDFEEGEESAKRAGIQNPNSSGQGYHPDHDKHPHHDTLKKYGYSYSHSTPVFHKGGQKDETPVLHHTYKRGDHNVSVHKSPQGGHVWQASKGGSGHQHSGSGDAKLAKYLKGRRTHESFDENYVTIAKYEVQQKRSDTPVEAHMQTPHLKDAKAKAIALSSTDPGTAYVTDQTKTKNGFSTIVAAYRNGVQVNKSFDESLDEVSLRTQRDEDLLDSLQANERLKAANAAGGPTANAAIESAIKSLRKELARRGVKLTQRDGETKIDRTNEGVALPDGRIFDPVKGVILEACDDQDEPDDDDEEDDADEVAWTEGAYVDEAKKRKMKGHWRTTKRGQRIFIENGKVTKGNPHLIKSLAKR